MTKTLYDTDFYAWTQRQAEALKAKDWAGVDIDNVAEEIESLGRNDRRAIGNHLQHLLSHLLKWAYQPSHRSTSWQDTIAEAREEIADLTEESPSLREYPTQRLATAYTRARREAARQTGLPLATFPEYCPWLVDDVLAEDWLPPEAP